ncbi:MAG TPA: DNA/RNA non-specific endonuclease [Polyangiaceae bacterium]|nr:DNA/RNA non-specific endonuclease [Polyangiaceae bacterium]
MPHAFLRRRFWLLALAVALVALAAFPGACATELRPKGTADGRYPPAAQHEAPAEPPPSDGVRVDRRAAAESVHAALGVPRDADDSDDTLLDETAFLVSYNPRLRTPNWVAWRLEAEDLGHVRRHDAFRADARLPQGFYRVTPRDYAHTDYDRGHLCPFADRSGTPEGASRTFVMTNMEPQLHELNAGPWEKLEQYERSRATDPERELYIVAGGVFDDDPKTIGHGVAVPRASFKIIVELSSGQSANDVTATTPTVAVEMPNEPGVGRRPWQDFVTSIDRIEADTGYDFLTAVAENVQAVIEARTPRSL